MGTLKVVALKAGFRKTTQSQVKTGDVFDIDDAKLTREENGKIALNKDGTLRKHKWLRPVSSVAEGKQIAAKAKKTENDKNTAAALAASGGAAARQKAADLGKAVAGGGSASAEDPEGMAG